LSTIGRFTRISQKGATSCTPEQPQNNQQTTELPPLFPVMGYLMKSMALLKIHWLGEARGRQITIIV